MSDEAKSGAPVETDSDELRFHGGDDEHGLAGVLVLAVKTPASLYNELVDIVGLEPWNPWVRFDNTLQTDFHVGISKVNTDQVSDFIGMSVEDICQAAESKLGNVDDGCFSSQAITIIAERTLRDGTIIIAESGYLLDEERPEIVGDDRTNPIWRWARVDKRQICHWLLHVQWDDLVFLMLKPWSSTDTRRPVSGHDIQDNGSVLHGNFDREIAREEKYKAERENCLERSRSAE